MTAQRLPRRHRRALPKSPSRDGASRPSAGRRPRLGRGRGADRLLRMWRNQKTLRSPDAAVGYLRRAVVNESRSALRRRRTVRLHLRVAEPDNAEPADAQVSGTRTIGRSWARAPAPTSTTRGAGPALLVEPQRGADRGGPRHLPRHGEISGEPRPGPPPGHDGRPAMTTLRTACATPLSTKRRRSPRSPFGPPIRRARRSRTSRLALEGRRVTAAGSGRPLPPQPSSPSPSASQRFAIRADDPVGPSHTPPTIVGPTTTQQVDSGLPLSERGRTYDVGRILGSDNIGPGLQPGGLLAPLEGLRAHRRTGRRARDHDRPPPRQHRA